ncbi:MAG: methyltransferase, partial [Pseudomonadota bacterium]
KALLDTILMAQPEEAKARYDARNPAETIEFFGLEPGMTVVEALPGGGWYSKILVPYLGEEGTLVGAHYPNDMWARFGFGEEWEKRAIARTEGWLASTEEWGIEGGATIASAIVTDMPDELNETADAVLFIRALHNLNRFDEDAGYMTKTLAETMAVLKPGGIVGVVQHAAPESNPDEWTDGGRGYLKRSTIVAAFEEAGFELVDESDVNANPLDIPGEGDIVWRLPPSLSGTEEGTPERAAMETIGESNRMTLKFRKPA